MAQSKRNPILTLTQSRIREYVPEDVAAVAQQCNNHNISQWMTNLFPHPYTLQDAHDWINHNLSIAANGPPQNFLIVDPTTDSAFGGIGIKPGTDVFAHTAEIGYWLGEEYWGRGIISEALPAFTGWVWRNRDVERLWAGVYDGNTASRRVLEKAGYRNEGRMRGHVRKEGVVKDLHIYGMTRAGIHGGGGHKPEPAASDREPEQCDGGTDRIQREPESPMWQVQPLPRQIHPSSDEKC